MYRSKGLEIKLGIALILVSTGTLIGSFISITSAQDAKAVKGGLNYIALSASTDYSVILREWKIRGVGFCIKDLKPRPCVRVSNPYPHLVTEVTREDMGSDILEVNLFLKALKPMKSATQLIQKTTDNASSHTPQGQGSRSIQYAETRVLDFSPPISQIAHGLPIAFPCIRSRFMDLKYVSELDAFGWRSELLDGIFYLAQTAGVPCDVQWAGNLQGCAGTWGAYYPRTGWANHSSSVIASYLQALRAARVPSEPGLGRIVLGPVVYPPRTGHFIQMVSPRRGAAKRIGSPNIADMELGNGSLQGKSIYIVFGIFDRCVGCDGCGTLSAARHP